MAAARGGKLMSYIRFAYFRFIAGLLDFVRGSVTGLPFVRVRDLLSY